MSRSTIMTWTYGLVLGLAILLSSTAAHAAGKLVLTIHDDLRIKMQHDLGAGARWCRQSGPALQAQGEGVEVPERGLEVGEGERGESAELVRAALRDGHLTCGPKGGTLARVPIEIERKNEKRSFTSRLPGILPTNTIPSLDSGWLTKFWTPGASTKCTVLGSQGQDLKCAYDTTSARPRIELGFRPTAAVRVKLESDKTSLELRLETCQYGLKGDPARALTALVAGARQQRVELSPLSPTCPAVWENEVSLVSGAHRISLRLTSDFVSHMAMGVPAELPRGSQTFELRSTGGGGETALGQLVVSVIDPPRVDTLEVAYEISSEHEQYRELFAGAGGPAVDRAAVVNPNTKGESEKGESKVINSATLKLPAELSVPQAPGDCQSAAVPSAPALRWRVDLGAKAALAGGNGSPRGTLSSIVFTANQPSATPLMATLALERGLLEGATKCWRSTPESVVLVVDIELASRARVESVSVPLGVYGAVACDDEQTVYHFRQGSVAESKLAGQCRFRIATPVKEDKDTKKNKEAFLEPAKKDQMISDKFDPPAQIRALLGPQRVVVTVQREGGTEVETWAILTPSEWARGVALPVAEGGSGPLYTVKARLAAKVAGDVHYRQAVADDGIAEWSHLAFSATLRTRGAFSFGCAERKRQPMTEPIKCHSIRAYITVPIEGSAVRFPAAPSTLRNSSQPAEVQYVPPRVGMLAAIELWDHVRGTNWLPLNPSLQGGLRFLQLGAQDVRMYSTLGLAITAPLFSESTGQLGTTVNLGAYWENDFAGNNHAVISASLNVGSLLSPPQKK